MTLTKSLLTILSALALSTGAALANPDESTPMSSLETTDEAYFAQSESMMTDPMTLAQSGQAPQSFAEEYYIVPIEVVELEEIWLIPSSDSELSLG